MYCMWRVECKVHKSWIVEILAVLRRSRCHYSQGLPLSDKACGKGSCDRWAKWQTADATALCCILPAFQRHLAALCIIFYIQSCNSSGIPFRVLISVPTIHGGLRQSSCCWMLVPAQHRLTARDGLQQILRIPKVAPKGKKSVTWFSKWGIAMHSNACHIAV